MSTMLNTLRPLVVCADDFGIEPGVDHAVVALALAGRLSATSCLTSSVRFPEAAPLLSGLPIDMGLHLNFTEFLGIPGLYTPLGRLIAMTYTRRISRVEVRKQIATQLDLFERHLKRIPDFVDGHLHVHQFPVIREELLEALTQRYAGSLPWLRDTRPAQMSSTLPFMQRFKAHVIGALGAHALVRLANRYDVVVNDGFLGAYDFSRPHPPYVSMLSVWLESATVNSVLMTHPAQYASDHLAFGGDRIEEYRVLASDDFGLLLENNHLKVARLSSVRL